MIRADSKSYREIREYLDEIPIVNTHEHHTGFAHPVGDVFSYLQDYFRADLFSAAFGEGRRLSAALQDTSLPFGERYAVFEKFYQRARHTAYGKSMLRSLQACWGIEEISEASLLKLQARLGERDQAFCDELVKKHRIVASIPDIPFRRFREFLDGESAEYAGHCRFAFPLPDFHHLLNRKHLELVQEANPEEKIVTLDDYVEGFARLLEKAVRFGVVCLKDQSAYLRPLDYGNPPKAEAEAVFNRLVYEYDGAETASSAEARALDDWLFHRFIRLARSHDIPVQLHTGHLAGNGGDIRKSNAAQLIPLLALHSDVRFDLFHANWPYMDECLFICKNYPNAYLNFCWTHIIDPAYCVEMMKRAVMTIPHSKIFAFGGDTQRIEWTIGYLLTAKDNVAAALSDLVDTGWLGREDAFRMAKDWFFHNPNEMYKLGLDEAEAGA